MRVYSFIELPNVMLSNLYKFVHYCFGNSDTHIISRGAAVEKRSEEVLMNSKQESLNVDLIND